MLKKILEKEREILSSANIQDVALNIAGVEKIRSEKLQSTLVVIQFEF